MCHTPRVKPKVTFINRVGLKRVSVGDGEQVSVGPTGTTLTGIGEVLETVQAHAMLYWYEYFTLIRLFSLKR